MSSTRPTASRAGPRTSSTGDTPLRRQGVKDGKAPSLDGGLAFGTGPGDVNVFLASYVVLEKLKLVNYEEAFCAARGIAPLNRTYFAYATSTPADQFFTFVSLVSWLLTLIGHTASSLSRLSPYDDPNETVSNLLTEIKGAGIATDVTPSKLRQGFGSPALAVLNKVLDVVLAAKRVCLSHPIYAPDEYPELGGEYDEGETLVEVLDETGAVEEDLEEEEEEFGVLVDERHISSASHKHEAKRLDPEQWKLELERVAPKLKVHVAVDTREWRAHLDRARQHKETINSKLPETRAKLERIQHQIARTLDSLRTREEYANRQFRDLVQDHQREKDKQRISNEAYASRNEGVVKLTSQLANLSEELEEVKAEMDAHGDSVTDGAPLIEIKKAASRLTAEIKHMDLRIGVLQHSLIDAQRKTRHAQVARLNSQSSIEGLRLTSQGSFDTLVTQ